MTRRWRRGSTAFSLTGLNMTSFDRRRQRRAPSSARFRLRPACEPTVESRESNKVGYAAQLQRGIAVRILRPFILLLSFCVLSLPALNGAAFADDAVKLKLQAVIVQGAKPLKDDIKW